MEVIIFPPFLYSYYVGTSMFKSPTFCTLWAYSDYTLYYLQVILVAWASIERHILIFHDDWLATSKKRFFIHYLPLAVIVFYCIIIYIPAFIFPGCDLVFDYANAPCYNYCYFTNPTALLYDTIVNGNLPTLIIFVFNIALIIRVLVHKYRMKQPIQWRKHRKMTIQMLSLSSLYLFCTLPYTFGTLLSVSGVSTPALKNMLVFVEAFALLDVLIYPLICMASVSEIHLKVKKILCLTKFRVGPTTT